MAKTANLYARIEPDVKEQAESILSALGIPASNAISKLEHIPEKYRRCEREPWRSRGLRVFPVDNCLVFYIPDMETKIVTVIRVMYGGRDVDKELERHTHYAE